MKRKVFSVLGVMPEPGGYAIAKFSRTPTYKSYLDWAMELTTEGAEKFYNTIYFQYGHSSIADLAHLMVVLENISVPARNLLLDEQLIDVQSRSTRYVDYSKCVFIIPPEIRKDKTALKLLNKNCRQMADLYALILEKVSQTYCREYLPKRPKTISEEDCQRITRVRAIDIARYLLPCAIPKSMGVYASARTWEKIITKFSSSDLKEFQEIGKDLQKAICQKQAINPSISKLDQVDWLSKNQKKKLANLLFGKNIGLPTLVKYAQAKDYPKVAFNKIKKLVSELKIKEKPDGERGVELFERLDPEIDFVTTLFYKISPYSFGQILKAVKAKGKKFCQKVIDLAFADRGGHDQAMRELAVGNLTFDVCMDIGGFRDLHRHRNCIQILKELTPDFGYDLPEEVKKVGLEKEFQKVMADSEKAYWQIEKKYPRIGQYFLAQAHRRRFLMRMSPWEVQYITELRSRPQGHYSYREIAFLMYKEFAKKYPRLAKHIRVTNPEVVDFFKR